MTRHEAREQAFSIIFEKIFSNDSIDEIIFNAVEGRDLEIDEFAKELCNKTIANQEEADKIISEYSHKWKINRLPKTTLSILRMAITEINCFDDIPVSVTANEAVELAKTYAVEEDASYINGILGAYIKNTGKK